MWYIKAEEVMAPARFLALTMHFVITLRVALDLDDVAMRLGDSTSSNYNDKRRLLAGFSYASLGCFAIEFFTLFAGVSLFIRGITLINTAAHIAGLILVCLFVYEFWNLNAFIAFVVTFSGVPMLVEVLSLLYQAVWAYASY